MATKFSNDDDNSMKANLTS
ncbi:hypothetical protein M6B38_349460 [Iris pallida]|uniref:Uncharacterized protein n=1 Tax=Iris pallida TaxID=29817 RepID=A0AAX6GRG0_IRIPA|nr:hypothetical protein M6B38_349460 [Iris pallida]